jgi:hypothetical protein
MNMSKNEEEIDWSTYVDPNSGAAPQPGGFVAHGESSVMPEPAGSDIPQVPDNDPEFEAKQEDASPVEQEGENPNADGQTGEQEPEETPASPAGEQEQGQPAEGEESGSSEGTEDAGTEGEGDATEEESVKDYSEVLSGTNPEVQKYIDEHPDEKDAVIAAEKAGKNRAGIVEY